MVNSEAKPDSGRKLFYGLFVFPLIIAVGMAILLCTVVLLTQEDETPESLITAIKTGSPSKRWQKAFELSNEINQGRGMIRKDGVMKEVIHIMNDREEYDEKTRAFMAITLSRFDEPEAQQALVEALRNETSPDVKLYLIWGLGVKRAAEGRALVEQALADENPELRKTAAYVLGVIGDEGSQPKLESMLQDGARDVRWNAALSLARLGSEAGYGELLKMADRALVSSHADITERQVEEVMINAVRGLSLLRRQEAVTVLKKLAETDQSLKVRHAAIEALEQTQAVAA